jgi:hypothetical protein
LALTSVKAQNPDPDAGVVRRNLVLPLSAFACRVSEPTVFSAHGIDALSQASMWMLVAVTILSD